MRKRRIEVKASQLDRLLGDLQAIPDTPPGHCLTDEESVDYTLGRLSEVDVERLDCHAHACPECAATLEHMLTEYERTPQPTRQPENVLAVLFAQLVESWNALVAQPLPLAATAAADQGQVVWEWQSSDGSAQAHAVVEANGDLTFRFASTWLDLAGQPVRLQTGSKRFETRLERVSNTEVGARIVVPRSDRPENLREITLQLG